MKLASFLDLVFPPRCLHCTGRIPRGVLCASCRGGIQMHTSLFCGACRARLPRAIKSCHPSFPYLLGAAGEYADPVLRDLIHGLKFRGVRSAAETLADILFAYVASLPLSFTPSTPLESPVTEGGNDATSVEPPVSFKGEALSLTGFTPLEISPDVTSGLPPRLRRSGFLTGFTVVPIPLHPARERARGFNQSALIARILARRLHIPSDTVSLVRVHATKPQSELEDMRERLLNVKGCFEAPPRACEGKRILLVDDVATSGATLLDASRALKEAGARKIIALVVAKA